MYPYPLLINLSATEPYYTKSVWHVEECRCTQVRCTPIPPLIKPSGTEHNYTRWVWHVEEFRCNQVTLHPPLINLVVQSPTTPGQMSSKFKMRCIHLSCNWTQCYRALLHQVSLTCGRMHTYSSQMYPPQSSLVLQTPTTPCLTCGRMQTYPGQMYHPLPY